MALTDTQIKKAKPAEKPIKLFDGDGLFLHVMPTGSKIWRLAYRADSKQTMLIRFMILANFQACYNVCSSGKT